MLLKDIIKEFSVRNKDQNDYPVYSVTNSQGFCRDYFGKEVASKDKSSYKIVPYGCFAYNPSRINVGSIDWQHCEQYVIVSPLYIVFEVDTKIAKQEYLSYYFKCRTVHNYINTFAKGTVRLNVPFSTLGNFHIPVPPIGEQERIVAELDLLQGIIEKKKEQLKAYDQLAQSIFYTMFGDPIDNPKGWETKCFSEIVHSTQLGLIRSAKMQSIDNKYLYFKMNNITSSGQMDLSNITRIDANSEEIEKYQLQKGDFLFNTRNSYELVGKSCVFNGKEKDIVLFNNNLLRIIFKNNTNSVFISYLFNDEYVKKQLNGIKKGTTSVWAVYYKDLAHIKVLAPPLSLQQEFAEKVEAIERQKALVQQSIEETQTMFDCTMDKYFG